MVRRWWHMPDAPPGSKPGDVMPDGRVVTKRGKICAPNWKKSPTGGKIHKHPNAKPLSKEHRPMSGTQKIKYALTRQMEMSLAAVQQIARDPKAPMVERLAAERIILAHQFDDPRSDRAFETLADRTEGKPRQSHHMEVERATDPAELLQKIKASLGWEDSVDEEGYVTPSSAPALEAEDPEPLTAPPDGVDELPEGAEKVLEGELTHIAGPDRKFTTPMRKQDRQAPVEDYIREADERKWPQLAERRKKREAQEARKSEGDE